MTGNPVGPSQFSEDITLDDVAASLRLEQGEVAAALIKARDSLQEQARLQQQREAKQAAAAAAAEAAERAKPKVGCNIAQLTGVSGTPSESNLCCTIRSTRLAACAFNIFCKASINVLGQQLTCSDTNTLQYWKGTPGCMAKDTHASAMQGPLLELSSQRLLFECASGTTSCTSLVLSNTGSTALHYRWERLQPHPHRRQTAMLFHMPDQQGAVLPNALHTFWYARMQPALCKSASSAVPCLPNVNSWKDFAWTAC